MNHNQLKKLAKKAKKSKTKGGLVSPKVTNNSKLTDCKMNSRGKWVCPKKQKK